MLDGVLARRVLQSVRSLKAGDQGPSTGDQWHDLLDVSRTWTAAKEAATGPRVLIATNLGGYQQGTVLESLLAVALTLRGARPEILLCDADLPACQLTKYAKISPRKLVRTGTAPVCPPCVAAGHDAFDALGLPVRSLGDQLDVSDALEIKAQVEAMDVARLGNPAAAAQSAVVEHARAGALRYYGLGDLRTESRGEEVLRLYLRAALTTERSMRRLLEREDFEVVLFHHGIYVPQGIVGEVCRDRGLRVVNSNPAYRKQTLIFSHGDSYHKTMLSEPISRWADEPLGPVREAVLDAYLRSRRTGEGDWIHFNTAPDEAAQSVYAETGLDPDKPIVGLLSNVVWDAQLHYGSNAFPGMVEWVHHTIEAFGRRDDVQLLIRVHPAEVTGAVPSRQPLLDEIRSAFPRLPSNVAVVAPESKLSTYVAMDLCDSVLIYNTKTGIELSAVGIPVVVAGEAWIRGKGFSTDVSSVEEYDAALAQLPRGSRMTSEEIERARRYAYHFFFRRMIPLPLIESPVQFQFDLAVADLAQLQPGATSGLDTICDGILKGTPFEHRDDT
ncbi:MAG: hypothetical protein QOE19_2587 [Actinomycetota bacterium]|nr:hypothetical protein [Actinomycetota bacterium]